MHTQNAAFKHNRPFVRFFLFFCCVCIKVVNGIKACEGSQWRQQQKKPVVCTFNEVLWILLTVFDLKHCEHILKIPGYRTYFRTSKYHIEFTTTRRSVGVQELDRKNDVIHAHIEQCLTKIEFYEALSWKLIEIRRKLMKSKIRSVKVR